MGRWGDSIYESDSALDYFATISDGLEREATYWFSSENVTNNSWWLATVLTVVEVMLLFDANGIGLSLDLKKPQVVIRWRETFLSVWDGDWKSDNHYTNFPHNEPNYRKLHRPGVIALFDHLVGIAQDWKELDRNDKHTKNAPLHPDYPLPYFSINHTTNRDNKKVAYVERFISNMIENRVQEIIYWITCERWIYVSEDIIPTAVDILGFLCETYDQSPHIPDKLVRTWREYALKMWQDSIGEGWGEADLMYQNIVKSFDRLEAMARKYPPMEW